MSDLDYGCPACGIDLEQYAKDTSTGDGHDIACPKCGAILEAHQGTDYEGDPVTFHFALIGAHEIVEIQHPHDPEYHRVKCTGCAWGSGFYHELSLAQKAGQRHLQRRAEIELSLRQLAPNKCPVCLTNLARATDAAGLQAGDTLACGGCRTRLRAFEESDGWTDWFVFQLDGNDPPPRSDPPWRVQWPAAGGSGADRPVVLSVEGHPIAAVLSPRVGDVPMLGAAPLMLEALENLENDRQQIPAEAWRMVQRAIAMARVVVPEPVR